MIDLNQDGKDDILQVKDFLNSAATDLLSDLNDAWEWVKAEAAKIKALISDGLEIIKAAIKKAFGDVGTRPLGEVVADTLTILYNTAKHVFDVVKSDFLTALIGLTSSPKIAVGA